MRQQFELGSLLQVLLASIALAPAGCGGSSVEETKEANGAPQGGSGGAPTVRIGQCKSEMVLDDSGWIHCERGLAHRETAGFCPSTVPRPSSSTGNACMDANCTGMPYGHCWPNDTFGTVPAPTCIPGCVSDADCGAGQICYCEEPVGRCIPADCTMDADCGPSAFCSTYDGPSTPTCFYEVAGAKCQTQTDACTGEECNCVMIDGARACVEGLGGCGRPFLVDGAARHAPAERRADWSATPGLPALLDELDAEVRAKLAEHWARSGLLEHASIAAFARFSLELVALGAPSELVAEAALAMADETRHARICFGLAAAYGGAPVGPGPLSVDGSLAAPTLESVVKTVVLEGCIGETIAAAEARELANTTLDLAVGEILEQIASDEARHATLAYRFVRWALEKGGAELGKVVIETVAREVERVRREPEGRRSDARTLSLGMPFPAFRASLRREVLERVIVPCVRGLVADADPAGLPRLCAA
jgi:hypothetical protein